MILEVKSVSKKFGNLVALSDVSFAVQEGEIFGIAGPNGSGKSTLFNVITGIYRPLSGQILLHGEEITRMSPHRVCRSGIARTFQVPTTFPSVSIYDNLRVGALFGGDGKQSVNEILDLLRLKDQADSAAHNLDLYSTKRVMLGAALATAPDLLLLDEPMAGLSLAEIEDFLQILLRLRDEREITVVVIEHLLDILMDISSRMLVLHEGGVLYMGSADGVSEDAQVIDVYIGKSVEAQGVAGR